MSLPGGPFTRLVVLLLTVSLTVGGGYWVYEWYTSCGEGVEKRGADSECTGVTDGSTSFAEGLDLVSARILRENASVANEPYVTIALMMPMTSDNEVERKRVTHSVQGAYLAQYRANQRGGSPAIRLVLANPGKGNAHWKPVVEQLEEMTAAPDNLRAVAGIGTSVSTARDLVKDLTGTRGIPVVGSSITADDIANSPAHPDRFPGLARVSPTNSAEAAALASYYSWVLAEDALVVEDRREGDNYIQTLRDSFHKLTEGAPRAPEEYRSPEDINTEGNTSKVFQQMINRICVSPAEVIYFAGRPVQLRQFVNELGRRGCVDNQYTVLTGDAGSSLAADASFRWSSLDNGITVRYTALAHRDTWTRTDAPGTGGSAGDYQELSNLAKRAQTKGVGPVGRVDLTDSQAIVAHDAVWTAVTAIRNTIDAPSDARAELQAVADEWPHLQSVDKVNGASGWICLDKYGNPYDKAVPVVGLDPRTKGPVFVGLAWPESGPPPAAADCTAPGSS